MIYALFTLLLAGHALAAWIYLRRSSSQLTLGEAYREDEQS
jgi:hypothetical protein